MGGGAADVNSWSCSGLMVFRRCWLSITLAFLFSSRSSSSLLSWPLPPPSSLWCRFCTITIHETIRTKKCWFSTWLSFINFVSWESSTDVSDRENSCESPSPLPSPDIETDTECFSMLAGAPSP